MKHWDSAFSRGVGYEPQPPGSFFEVDRVRGYFVDFRAKTASPEAAAPETLLPADLAQLGLGFWERMLHGDHEASTDFSRVCTLIDKKAERRGGELRWPYDVRVPKYRVEAPIYSGLAQAQIASVFVRAYALTGDARYAEDALGAIRPLLETESELVSGTTGGPVPEECPSDPPSHILNGWIYALWGLWEVHIALGDSRSGSMLTASTACLRNMLSLYDTGWWTKYSLYPHRVADLAKPFYHRLHIDQAEIMYRLTGFPEFRAAARRWRSYDTRLHRSAAVMQKAVFVATRYA